ncbi:cytochrome c biogenesis CcdA family protein [Nocardiopsis dassonvillei]|uniref:cytochrome c biogenesis CcdA family protein n=1 Tax=Nocardiopsis dassonvillei TaxID=2014 RepID=UPI00200F9305|nr:cytochrome c biogenesis CcdA family protein [Nocardiopsis dassonvillei]MCK9868143.1 cytochrome c biogenesis CcdA family protein [Nocardiopsis dassonvillei]
MADVGLVAALAGGVLALFSPCSALLLPSFFGYAFRDPRRLLARTGVFYLGLCTTLVPLGAGSAAVSRLFYGERELLITVAGSLVIAFGVAQIVGFGFSSRLAQRLQGRFSGRTNTVSVFGLGAVYGFAGFCSGPILGAVLTVAATGGPLRGAVLLAVYALGMAGPLFVLALLWDRYDLGEKRWLRGRTVSLGPVRVHTTSTLSGLLFVAIGIVFLRYDGTASLFGGVGAFDDQSYRVQEWLFAVGGAGIDVFVLAAAGVALLAAGVWQWSRSRGPKGSEGRDPAQEGQEGPDRGTRSETAGGGA